jgi:hypothetical protein
VRGQAVITRLALEGEAAVDFAASLLDSTVAEQALVALLEYGGARGAAIARHRLEAMAHAEHSANQICAAHVLEQTTAGDFGALLLGLLEGPEPAVRQAAIEAAGRRFQPAVGQALLGLLGSRQHRGAAQRALGRGGEASAAWLTERFTTLPPGERLAAVQALGYTRSPTAIRCLTAQLEPEAPAAPLSVELRQAMLQALHQSAYRAATPETVLRQLQTEAVAARWALTGQLAEPADLLQRAWAAELEALRQRTCWLLAFLDDKLDSLPRALVHASADQRACALAALEETLPAPIKQLALPLLAELPPAKKLASLPGEVPPEGAALWQAVAEQPALFSAWTRTCARYQLLQSQNQPMEAAMLTLIEKVILLRSVSIFAQTPDAVLAELAEALCQRRAARGEVLIHQGELDEAMYLIISGQVRVHEGDLTIAERGPGEIIGEMAVLDPAPRSASVTALSDCEFFVLERATFYEVIAAQPEVVHGVLRVLVGRLRERRPTTSAARDE